eukprot:SAG31_NODE_44614_length_262_cov_0.631902_1_plen_27_part_10
MSNGICLPREHNTRQQQRALAIPGHVR